MDWITGIQKAIDYVEAHITEPIDYEEAAKRALGLDLMNITTGSIDPDEPLNKETAGYYNIEIGKYLIPNLMVTYSQGLNNNDKVYGVRYKLGKHTSTRAWRSSNNHSFVGAYWKTTF